MTIKTIENKLCHAMRVFSFCATLTVEPNYHVLTVVLLNVY